MQRLAERAQTANDGAVLKLLAAFEQQNFSEQFLLLGSIH
jgi:hypothetical protein